MITHSLVLTATLFVWLSGVAALFQLISRDARARDSDQPGTWALAVVVALPLALPYYAYSVSLTQRLGARATPPDHIDRLLATWANGCLGAILAGSVLAPPDPFSQLRAVWLALVVSLPVSYLLVYRGGSQLVLKRLGG